MLFSPLPVSTECSTTIPHLINRDSSNTHEVEAQLMAMILHELRSPLSTIALSAEILEEDIACTQRQKHLNRIQAKVKQMTHLLENLTLLLYGNSEDLKPNLESVNLTQLCTKLIAETKFSTDIHNVTFTEYNQDPTCKNCAWADACIDENLFARSISNLLYNAIKYSPQGGDIALTLIRRTDCFILKVRDSGIGIASEDLPFVFDWFYRGINSTLASGSGLGLAIVKRCVELHQGTISIQSHLNIGTHIKIRLPLGR